jgi:predicted GIY-YIG superfamily endonuclease
MWFVYLLKCRDNTYYTGCTNNVYKRFERHTKGYVQYTKSKRPLELVSYVAFNDKYKAYNFEKYLKSGSGTAFRNKRLI